MYAITDRVLRLHGEQKARQETLDLGHARNERLVGGRRLAGRLAIAKLKVAVRIADHPPDDAEACPGEQKTHGEHHQRPTPLCIH